MIHLKLIRKKIQKIFVMTLLTILLFFEGLSSLAPSYFEVNFLSLFVKSFSELFDLLNKLKDSDIKTKDIESLNHEVLFHIQACSIPQDFNEFEHSNEYREVELLYFLAAHTCQPQTMRLLIFKILKCFFNDSFEQVSDNFIKVMAKEKAPHFVKMHLGIVDRTDGNKSGTLKKVRPFKEFINELFKTLSPFKKSIKSFQNQVEKMEEKLIKKVELFPWDNFSLCLRIKNIISKKEEKLLYSHLKNLFLEVCESENPSLIECFIKRMLSSMNLKVEGETAFQSFVSYYTSDRGQICNGDHCTKKVKQRENGIFLNLINQILINPVFHPVLLDANTCVKDEKDQKLIELKQASETIYYFISNMKNHKINICTYLEESLEVLQKAFITLLRQVEERPALFFRILAYVENLAQVVISQEEGISIVSMTYLNKIFGCFYSFSNDEEEIDHFFYKVRQIASSSMWKFYFYGQLTFEMFNMLNDPSLLLQSFQQIECFFSNDFVILKNLNLETRPFEIKIYLDFLDKLDIETFDWDLVQKRKEEILRASFQKYQGQYQCLEIKYFVEFLSFFYFTRNQFLRKSTFFKQVNILYNNFEKMNQSFFNWSRTKEERFFIINEFLNLNSFFLLKALLKKIDFSPKILRKIDQKLSFMDLSSIDESS